MCRPERMTEGRSRDACEEPTGRFYKRSLAQMAAATAFSLYHLATRHFRQS